ncbi:hypothetical protein Lfu02_65000 [Longispora fulva]|uniref:Uncharacterized protein n=1 Tax=Longispora fulva TaxID=619741 RepID=A0A8J7GUN7_9ACTN|nr:hypothetical protein [Longispora fulva]MBG6137716.1 hypothetical protein [Longispora fulva]GIG62128.1 hypothetical protein Lfu02_65000 [Longispora fulva]
MSDTKATPPAEWHLALPVRFGLDKGSTRVSLAVHRPSLHSLMYFAALANAARAYLPAHHPGAGPAILVAVYCGCAALALLSATVVSRLSTGERASRLCATAIGLTEVWLAATPGGRAQSLVPVYAAGVVLVVTVLGEIAFRLSARAGRARESEPVGATTAPTSAGAEPAPGPVPDMPEAGAAPVDAVASAVRLLAEVEDVARHADRAGLCYLVHRAGALAGTLAVAASTADPDPLRWREVS